MSTYTTDMDTNTGVQNWGENVFNYQYVLSLRAMLVISPAAWNHRVLMLLHMLPPRRKEMIKD